MLSDRDTFRFMVGQGLKKGLATIRGMRKALSEEEQQRGVAYRLSFDRVPASSNSSPGGTSTHAPQEPVAQVVEHLTFNQVVLGSSPSGLTK